MLDAGFIEDAGELGAEVSGEAVEAGVRILGL